MSTHILFINKLINFVEIILVLISQIPMIPTESDNYNYAIDHIFYERRTQIV